MKTKEYTVCVWLFDHTSIGSRTLEATSPCHALEIYVDEAERWNSYYYAEVICENGLTFTFDTK